MYKSIFNKKEEAEEKLSGSSPGRGTFKGILIGVMIMCFLILALSGTYFLFIPYLEQKYSSIEEINASPDANILRYAQSVAEENNVILSMQDEIEIFGERVNTTIILSENNGRMELIIYVRDFSMSDALKIIKEVNQNG